MGSTYIQGFIDESTPDELDSLIRIHLQSNHYPPVPACMVKPCRAAVQAAEDGDYEVHIVLPKGVTWLGHGYVTAAALIDQHHLGCFINCWG
jgi:hypothetical protein